MKSRALSLLAVFLVVGSALGQEILSINNISWGQNIGSVHWRPGDGTGVGIEVAPTYISGWIWAQNFGWIGLGDGTPDNMVAYSNTSATDYGVNRDVAGTLTGHAWSPNMGWITFEQVHGMPQIDVATGALSGYAWSANFGWLYLGDLLIDVDPTVARIWVEGEFVTEAAGMACVTVKLDGPAPGNIAFDYATQDDTAIAGEDYSTVSGSALILEDETEFEVMVPILPDAAPELDQSFKLVLSNVQGADPLSLEGTVTILDDPCTDLRNIFWSEQGSGGAIGGSDLNGEQVAALVTAEATSPMGIEVSAEHVYFLDDSQDVLVRVRRDGSSAIPLVSSLSTAGPGDLTVVNDKLYWALSDGVLERVDLNGTNRTVVRSDLGQPIQLAVFGSSVYWTEAGGKIRRANLDGTGTPVDLLIGLETPFGIDVTSDGIFWSEGGTSDSIMRADLDGTNVQSLVLNAPEPRGLAVADRFVYWISVGFGPNRIQRARTDALNEVSGADVGMLVGLNDPWDLDVTTSAELSLTTATDPAVLPDLPVPAPGPIPPSGGTLDVSIHPAGIGGQWRFKGEIFWRDGTNETGSTVPGITTGDYVIEFKPVRGYTTPQPYELAAVVDPGMTPVFTVGLAERSYVLVGTNPGTGSLRVTTTPDSITVKTWKISSLDASFRVSGELVSSLPAGEYVIEFDDVPNRVRPPSRAVVIEPGIETRIQSAYSPASGAAGGTSALSFAQVSTERPYFHLGQIQTPRGVGSGFVVREKVVLSAAHVVFDDLSFTWLPDGQFYQQRYRGAVDHHEPPPVTARGYYFFDTYESQRVEDDSPGESTTASQNLDVAALFFVEDDWRGGYGGYLATGADENEWLTGSREKLIAGYPAATPTTTGVPHVTSTTTTSGFSRPDEAGGPRVFTIDVATLRGTAGMSGGPVQVRFNPDDPGDLTGGDFYPAAIYLGGTGSSVVRAIDCDVVRLINRASTSANNGGNSGGGGLDYEATFSEDGGEGFVTASLNIAPRGAFRIVGQGPSWKSPGDLVTVPQGLYDIEFRSEVGYIAPSTRVAAPISANQINVVSGVYLATYDSFVQFYFPEEDRDNPAISGPNADPDEDRIDNLTEWAFNLSPVDATLQEGPTSGLPVVRLVDHMGNQVFGIEFIRRRAGTTTGLSYTAQFSEDLQNWSSAGNIEVELDQIDDNFERVVIVPAGPDGVRRFARVQLDLAAP